MFVNVKEYWSQIKMGTDSDGLNQINFAIIPNMRITITRYLILLIALNAVPILSGVPLLFTALSGVLLLFTKLNSIPSSLTGIQNEK